MTALLFSLTRLGRLAAIIAIALGLFVPSAQAQRLDLGTVKCSEFFAGGKDNIERVMMWLEAYYSEENASPIIDYDKLRSDEAKLRDYCGKDPGTSLIEAAEKTMGK